MTPGTRKICAVLRLEEGDQGNLAHRFPDIPVAFLIGSQGEELAQFALISVAYITARAGGRRRHHLASGRIGFAMPGQLFRLRRKFLQDLALFARALMLKTSPDRLYHCLRAPAGRGFDWGAYVTLFVGQAASLKRQRASQVAGFA